MGFRVVGVHDYRPMCNGDKDYTVREWPELSIEDIEKQNKWMSPFMVVGPEDYASK